MTLSLRALAREAVELSEENGASPWRTMKRDKLATLAKALLDALDVIEAARFQALAAAESERTASGPDYEAWCEATTATEQAVRAFSAREGTR